MRWSKQDLANYMANQEPVQDDKPDPGPESYLQSSCVRYCRDKGWPVFHDWSRKRNQAGWPDMFIFAPGRVILVELKAAGGRLSQEQITLRHMLNYLGHTVKVCRSYKRFVEIVDENARGDAV